MSCNGSLLIDNQFEILGFSNHVPDFLMTIFRSSDQLIYPIIDDDGEEEIQYVYRIRVSDAIDRLVLLGASVEKAKDALNNQLESELGILDFYEDMKIDKNPEVLFYKNFTFDQWQTAMAKIIENDIKQWNVEDKFPAKIPDDIKFVIGDHNSEHLFGLSGDFFSIILAILKLIKKPESSLLTLEYTELVHGGYIGKDCDLCVTASEGFTNTFVSDEKIIVLTEGISDRLILEKSLEVIFPHLFHYVSFLDFEGVRLPGGTSFVVHMIKSFASAGIKNRIIAVFDNDTAAEVAIRNLRDIKLPKNIQVMKLPDIEICKNYPTVGPQGNVSMNINGLAGSIELYVEPSTLRDNSGELYPIHWKGFEPSIQKYQGEISNKIIIQNKYLALLNEIKVKKTFDEFDLSVMKSLLEKICGLRR